MGEFDLSLIQEFRNRPSLYDRNSLQFKDKLYNAHQWQEISNKLGYDVSILKDRMLQLRNRYNLEKRRMEQLREENPGKHHESPWPLYTSLQFLSEHIKARRRYKHMIPTYKEDSPINDSGNDYSALGPDDANLEDSEKEDDPQYAGSTTTAFPNGMLTVKVEENSEGREDSDNDVSEVNSTSDQQQQQLRQHLQQQQQLLQQHQQLQQLRLRQVHELQHQNHHTQSPQPTRTLKRSLPNQNGGLGGDQHQQTTPSLAAKRSFKQMNHDNNTNSFANETAAKASRAMGGIRENKYNAFGNFIASSLLDLPHKMALGLLEKFTSDIVKALILKDDNLEASQQQQQQRQHSEQ